MGFDATVNAGTRCDRNRLRDRVTAFYEASAAERWADVWSFVDTEAKRDFSFDTFVPKFQRLQPNKGATVRIAKIDCGSFCVDGTDPDSVSAEVWLKIKVVRADRVDKYRG